MEAVRRSPRRSPLAASAGLSAYELQRNQNIRSNHEVRCPAAPCLPATLPCRGAEEPSAHTPVTHCVEQMLASLGIEQLTKKAKVAVAPPARSKPAAPKRPAQAPSKRGQQRPSELGLWSKSRSGTSSLPRKASPRRQTTQTASPAHTTSTA